MRVESLTFFRFIVAFIVVIFHFGIGIWFTKFFGRFVTARPEMVSFFFVLSGFVMMISQFKKEKFSTSKYYYARFARIFPVYLIGLLIFIPLKFNINPIFNSTSFLLSLMLLICTGGYYVVERPSQGFLLKNYYYIKVQLQKNKSSSNFEN